jgi:hypothetical protein
MEEPKKEIPRPHSDDKKEDTQLIPQTKKQRPEVITVRNWREYLGESLLIIFSVVLALFLTERFTKLHEEQQTRQILRELRAELIDNERSEQLQYAYHLQVLKNINAALHDSALAKSFIKNGEIDSALRPIAPQGVLIRDLNDVAWQIAKQNNVFSKIDLNTYSVLTDIYDNQQRITNSELQIGELLLSWESRKPENLRTTLILMRDNYRAWAVDRAPHLLSLYKQAIDKLKDY